MKRRIPTIMVLGALAASPNSVADSPETWQCNFCTYASGWFGSARFGAGWAGDAPSKFADYRGISDDGAFMSLGGEAHYRNDSGVWLDMYARDLGNENRSLVARGGSAGRFEWRLGYREITRHPGHATRTPFLGQGSTVLSLPADWVAGDATSGMTVLVQSLRPAPLRTLRKIFNAGFGHRLPGAWRFDLDYRHVEKAGTRPFGAGVFTLQSTVFPAPIDFNNDRVDLSFERSGAKGVLRLGFTGSLFNNRHAAVTWQNPFEPVGDTHWLRAALEPDSSYRQLTLNGVWRLRQGVRVSGSAALGRIRQDGEFLPYSIHPDFEKLPLPRASLEQEVDSRSFRLTTRLTARLSDRLDFSAQARADKRDNRTPVDTWKPVVTEILPRQDTANRPYSFERRQYRTELAYRSAPALRLRTGFGRREYERSLQSVRETEQDTVWGEANFDRWAAAQLRLRLENTTRDISPYAPFSDPGLQENPLMRKFNLADMERERIAFDLDLAPAGALSVSLGYRRSRDEYERSQLGLMDSREESVNLDLAYRLGRDTGLHLFVSREEIDSVIAGAPAVGAIPWRADSSDRFTVAGAGFQGRFRERFGFEIRYLLSASEGLINTDSGPGEAPFPVLRTRLANVRARLDYHLNERWGWTLHVEQERYRSVDWQVDGLGPDGIEAILTLGPDSPDYDVTVLRLEANYRF